MKTLKIFGPVIAIGILALTIIMIERGESAVARTPAQFGLALPFSQNLAAVMSSETGTNGKWGYINRKGYWVIDPQYDWAGSFSEGLAAVGMHTGGSDGYFTVGYVNSKGVLVIPLRFFTVAIGGLQYGLPVGVDDPGIAFHGGIAAVGGFINKRGEQVLPLPSQ